MASAGGMRFPVSLSEMCKHKKAAAPQGVAACDNRCGCFYSPGAIAPVGQTSAQVPQSTQASGLIEYFAPSEIAPAGHSSMQVPHAMQSSEIT